MQGSAPFCCFVFFFGGAAFPRSVLSWEDNLWFRISAVDLGAFPAYSSLSPRCFPRKLRSQDGIQLPGWEVPWSQAALAPGGPPQDPDLACPGIKSSVRGAVTGLSGSLAPGGSG